MASPRKLLCLFEEDGSVALFETIQDARNIGGTLEEVIDSESLPGTLPRHAFHEMSPESRPRSASVRSGKGPDGFFP